MIAYDGLGFFLLSMGKTFVCEMKRRGEEEGVDIDTVKYTNIEEKFHVVDIDLDERTHNKRTRCPLKTSVRVGNVCV